MEYITLNSYSDNLNSNYKGEEFYHKNSLTVDRESLKDDTKYIYVTAKEEFLTGKDIKDREQADDEKIYLNDAGILWSNRVYLVKIVIKYNSISFGEYVDNELEWITKYRWYWTNTLFNSYFSGVDVKAPQDFKDLEFVLDLNCISIFDTIKDKYKIESIEYRRDSEEEINSSDQYKSLSATVQYINLVSEGDTPVDNVKMAIRAGLQDDYNTFNLNEEGLSDIYVNIYAANDYLYNVEEQPEVQFSSENGTIFPGIYPVNAKECTGQLDPDNQSSNFFKKVGVTHLNPSGSGGSFDTKHIYSDTDNYINYPNNFLISLSHTYKNEGDWSKKVFHTQTLMENRPLQRTVIIILLPQIRYILVKQLNLYRMINKYYYLFQAFTIVNIIILLNMTKEKCRL